MNDDQIPAFFDIIVHVMEVFVVIGIAASVYYVKKSKKKKPEQKAQRAQRPEDLSTNESRNS